MNGTNVSRLIESSDGGISWPITLNGNQWPPYDPVFSLTALGVIDTELFAATADGAVHRSSDSGKTWLIADTGLIPYEPVGSFSEFDGHLFATVEDKGIFESANSGASWSQIDTSKYFYSVCAIAPNTFLVSESQGVFIS